jgi:hypothetical protein
LAKKIEIGSKELDFDSKKLEIMVEGLQKKEIDQGIAYGTLKAAFDIILKYDKKLKRHYREKNHISEILDKLKC